MLVYHPKDWEGAEVYFFNIIYIIIFYSTQFNIFFFKINMADRETEMPTASEISCKYFYNKTPLKKKTTTKQPKKTIVESINI